MASDGVGSRHATEMGHDPTFVEVMFAKSHDEAAYCRDLLEQESIPARIEADPAEVRSCGIAVLAPAQHLVLASELLADRIQDDHPGDNDLGEDIAALDDLDDDDDYADDDDCDDDLYEDDEDLEGDCEDDDDD